MQALSFINSAIFIAFAVALVGAAITDLKHRKISNNLSLTIVGLYGIFAVSQLLAGADWKIIAAWPLASAAFVFLLGAALFAANLMGGGDVKLLAAITLFAGPTLGISFILYVTIAGGLVALATLLHARIKSLNTAEAKVPYGVAISLGGLWVCYQRFSTLSA